MCVAAEVFVMQPSASVYELYVFCLVLLPHAPRLPTFDALTVLPMYATVTTSSHILQAQYPESLVLVLQDD